MPLGTKVGLNPGDSLLDGDPAPLPTKGVEPPPQSIFGPFLLWPNGWMHQDATWYGGRPQPRGLCVRWGPSRPLSRKGDGAHQFSTHCGQTAVWIKMALGVEVGLGSVQIVLHRDTAPYPKRGHSPQFSVHLYCGQTAGCINMPLGMEVGLSPGDIVFDVDPDTPKKGHTHHHPILAHVYCGPNGWMDEDAAWYGSRPRPRPHCTRQGPSSLRKGHSSPPPSFRPMSIVATVAHLSYAMSVHMRILRVFRQI